MKLFIKQLLLFLLPLFLLLLFIIYSIYTNPGGVDPFYYRFCTPRYKSLIVGSSRAAQGIDPDIINHELSATFEAPIYNYSFTVSDSPYGQLYFNSIKEKLNATSSNGLFIVTVDPWSIGNIEEMGDINEITMREKNSCIAKIKNVTVAPNLQYLMEYFDLPSFINSKISKESMGVNSNGRLEVKIPIIDSLFFENNIYTKLEIYKKYTSSYYRSIERESSLDDIIKMLKGHGNVFLVRIPVHEKMYKLEDIIFPDFDEYMNSLSLKNGIIYFSFRNSTHRYQTTDGNHLLFDDGCRFTQELCDSIKNKLMI